MPADVAALTLLTYANRVDHTDSVAWRDWRTLGAYIRLLSRVVTRISQTRTCYLCSRRVVCVPDDLQGLAGRESMRNGERY